MQFYNSLTRKLTRRLTRRLTRMLTRSLTPGQSFKLTSQYCSTARNTVL